MSKLHLLILLPAVALAADEVQLKLAPGGPVEYWVRTVDTRADMTRDRAAEPFVSETLSQTSQTATATTSGALAIRIETRDTQAWAAGHSLEGRVPPKASAFALKPTGARLDGAPLTPESALSPVFPEAPVKPGHRWSVTVPASPKVPADLTVTYTFEKVDTVHGARCAVVTSKGTVKGKLPIGSFALQVDGRTLLNLGDGQVESATGELRTVVQRDAPSQPSGYVRHTIKVIRAIKRKTAADATPPDSPGK